MIASIAHVNLTVHPGTLDDATEFYSQTLGLTPSPVPELQRGTILWYESRQRPGPYSWETSSSADWNYLQVQHRLERTTDPYQRRHNRPHTQPASML